MTAIDRLDVLADEGRLLSLAAHLHPATSVPSCPGWTVVKMVRHIGAVHHRAALIVSEGRTESPDPSESAPPRGDPFAWYEEGLAQLLTAFRTADPAENYWTFRGPKPLAWWIRRIAHETAVHRVDAEQAVGQVGTIEPSFAADGIGEHFETYLPVLASRSGAHTERSVHLHATDIEGEWIVTFGGDRLVVSECHADGDATIRGPAAGIYLWLWGRASLAELSAVGDRTAVEQLRTLARV